MMAPWDTLAKRHAAIGERPILALFEDGMRAEDFSVQTQVALQHVLEAANSPDLQDP